MGQRHQIIAIYPPKQYAQADNSNNRPERAEVIHHQWLYGHSAICAFSRVVTLAKNIDAKRDFIFGRFDGYASEKASEAIAAAISVDPESGYYARCSPWEREFYDGDSGYALPHELSPDQLDNNDGVTIIQFKTGESKPLYVFATPNHLEGSHWQKGRGPWTAREYLAFYYSPEEQETFDKELKERVNSALKNIEENAIFLGNETAKLLPKFNLGKVKKLCLLKK